MTGKVCDERGSDLGGETMMVKHLGAIGDRACGAHAFDGESVYAASAATCPRCLEEIAKIRTEIARAREAGATDLANALARYLGEDEDSEDEDCRACRLAKAEAAEELARQECDCRACRQAKAEAAETLARRCECRRTGS